jgi:hypothetical protein
LSKLTEHLRFDNFAKNETVNCEIGKEIGLMNNSGHFIRKGISVYIYVFSPCIELNEFKFGCICCFFVSGKTGDWKNHFSPELNGRIDEWMRNNLKGTDLRFITELEQQD